MHVVAVTAGSGSAQPFRLSSPYRWDDASDADTVIVLVVAAEKAPHPRALRWLKDAEAAGKRITSTCTWAFVLARAGLRNP
ncbi:hypothetical protein [Streptomyces sp. Tu 2975]|uniref:hypothetical protein n=1 Tax=Streptomyces sp. Tu 2975 TaxID=2676871 RepID=UPI001ABE4733|nr:hypothetical protein [Streptomyces sp. Tu 2975]